MSKYASLAYIAAGNSRRTFDVLSADEEKELSKRILDGEAARVTLINNENLTAPERIILEKVTEDGKKACDRLVLANLPRARKFALETFRKNPQGLNTPEDYEQAALKVICTCAKTYDWQIGCRFGTYVHRCLKNEMLRENARTGYALRIPEEQLPILSALRQKAETDGIEKAADKLGIKPDHANDLLIAGSISKSMQDPVSEEDPDMEFGDLIADTTAMTAEEIEAQIDQDEMIQKLRQAFSSLPEAEQDLLKGRMGLNGVVRPMKDYVGIVAKSISGVQKKQLAAEKHLREIYFSLPMAD